MYAYNPEKSDYDLYTEPFTTPSADKFVTFYEAINA